MPYGGRETAVFQLQKFLKQQGHDVFLICNEEYLDWKEELNCNIISVGKYASTSNMLREIFGFSPLEKNIKFLNPFLLDIMTFKFKSAIIKSILSANLDVINFHEQGSLRIYSKELNHIPTVYTFHGDLYDWSYAKTKTSGYRKKGIRNTKSLINNMNAITAVGKDLRERLIKQKLDKKISVINNGIDFSFIREVTTKKILKTKDLNIRRFFLILIVSEQFV